MVKTNHSSSFLETTDTQNFREWNGNRELISKWDVVIISTNYEHISPSIFIFFVNFFTGKIFFNSLHIQSFWTTRVDEFIQHQTFHHHLLSSIFQLKIAIRHSPLEVFYKNSYRKCVDTTLFSDEEKRNENWTKIWAWNRKDQHERNTFFIGGKASQPTPKTKRKKSVSFAPIYMHAQYLYVYTYPHHPPTPPPAP